ncbi:MAG: MaoC family dehydratase [Proteobacteria bacterium]|nr:MaoC family dehydratase [Pseudomonadota bacterium]
MEDLYFEDFTLGRVFVTAGVTLTEAAIVDFAFQYDPQPFHLDREAAQHSIFGGLVASGFQTQCLSFRMFAQLGTLRNNLGGPGIDAIRWPRPVHAGDTIHCRVTVGEQRASRSKPDRGTIRWDFETLNQRDEVVMTASFISFMRRRET